jgi:hypothetical protein
MWSINGGQSGRCGGQVEVLQHVVRADVQQHRVGGEGLQPAHDVGVDLVDAPARVPFVVVVAQAGRSVELRSDEVDPVAVAIEALPEADPVAAGHLGSFGDGVTERHDPHAAV